MVRSRAFTSFSADTSAFMSIEEPAPEKSWSGAAEPTEVIKVYRNDFSEMIRYCYELTAALVHVMLDRARHFTSSYLHDEKLVSLGKLAAGLAHELNNP